MNGYRIKLDGETFQIEILSDPRQDEVTVRIDGETLTVSVSPLEDVAQPSRSSSRTLSSGRPDPAEPVVAATQASPAQSHRRSPDSDGMVRSPLPGTIIAVAVRPGQNIAMGEELLVIEAMKMNNRIRSPRDGTVGEVLVQIGEQVSHGALLLSWAV